MIQLDYASLDSGCRNPNRGGMIDIFYLYHPTYTILPIPSCQRLLLLTWQHPLAKQLEDCRVKHVLIELAYPAIKIGPQIRLRVDQSFHYCYLQLHTLSVL